MTEIVTRTITNLFRIFLIYCFARVFLGKPRFAKWMTLVIPIIYCIVNLAMFWTFHSAWINVSCNLLGTFAVVWLFTKSFKSNLFVTCSVTIINICCDALVTSLFVKYVDGQGYNPIYEVLTDFCILICLLLCGLIVRTHEHAEQGFRLSLLSVPICSIATALFMLYFSACTEKGYVILGLSLLVINFFMLYQYNKLLQSISQKYENELLEQRIQIYSNQLNVIMQNEERTKALHHDIKHHMNELMILAQNNKTAELMQYLSKMNEALQNPDEIVASGNMEVDSVLNYHLHRAKEELVTVTANAVLPEDMKHSFDVIVVLGNLLDNAIEAAGQSEKKYLGVDINFQKGILFIQIDNSYVPKNSLSKAPRQTTPATNGRSFKHQGLGLKNVQRIVDAHNGKIEINEGSDLYSVKVMLYMSQSE